MKEQRFACINNDDLKRLNSEGWFVKQVVERYHYGLMCDPVEYYVLLERLVNDN